MADPSEYECVISDALYAVVRASQAVLAASVRLKRLPVGWKMRLSTPLGGVNVALTVALAILSITSLVIVDDQLVWINTLTLIYDRTLSLSIYIVIITTYSVVGFTAPTRMKTLIQCLRNIEKVKTSLNNTSIKRYPKLKIAVILYILYGMITIASEVRRIYIPLKNNYGMMCLCCAFTIQGFVIFLAVLQFAVTVIQVNSVLQDVNDALLQLLLEKQGNVQVAPKIETSAETVQKVSIVHGTICDVIEDFNRSNACVIVATLLMSLMDLTLLSYALLGPFLSVFLKDMTINIITNSNWIIFYTSRFLLIVEPCHSTQCKLRCTRSLVSKLSLEYADQPTSEELYKFHHRLRLDHVSFSPMDVCTLHRPLIITMAATVATYSVIISQYRELNDDDT